MRIYVLSSVNKKCKKNQIRQQKRFHCNGKVERIICKWTNEKGFTTDNKAKEKKNKQTTIVFISHKIYWYFNCFNEQIHLFMKYIPGSGSMFYVKRSENEKCLFNNGFAANFRKNSFFFLIQFGLIR